MRVSMRSRADGRRGGIPFGRLFPTVLLFALVVGVLSVDAGLSDRRSIPATIPLGDGTLGSPMMRSGLESIRFMAAAADTVQIVPGSIFFLEPNVPNPFVDQTSIGFSLDADYESVRLVFYDAFYNEVEVLLDASLVEGRHQHLFVPGGRYASGMYFYSLIVEGKERQTRRMILVR